MGKRIVVVLVGLMALALLAVGCGGSDDEGPTKAEFVAEGTAICEASVKQIGADLRAAGQKGASPDATTEAIVSNFSQQLDELEALEPPAGDEQQVEKMLRQMRKGVEEAEAVENDALFSGDNQLGKGRAMAESYGLERCGVIF